MRSAGAHKTPGLPTLSDREFQNIARLVFRETGIALAPHKRALIVARLASRLRELALDSFGEYYELVVAEPAELARLVDRVTTHETRFFREGRHFALLEQAPYPRWHDEARAGRRPKQLRFWSAGCATGEEAFSIAMSARSHFPLDEGWTVEVVGTDVSQHVLEVARSATWPIEKAADIPDKYRKAFMLRGTGSQVAKMRAGRELRSLVHFRAVNLNDESSRALGSFDAIFCCNVLIYFDPGARKRAIKRLLDRLKPEGYLFLGHAESLTGLGESVRCLAPNVYMPVPAGSP